MRVCGPATNACPASHSTPAGLGCLTSAHACYPLDAQRPQAHQGAGRLGFVAGLIPQEKMPGFERLLFRATRGNMFLRTTPVGSVKDPASGEQVGL